MFCYGEDGWVVFDNVNLYVKLGEVVVLVGLLGSGKIMLVNLLLCFFDFILGMILFDGEVLVDLVLYDLCCQIVFVSQDVVLFNDIIVVNVVYGV